MTYEQFIKNMNEGILSNITFEVEGYAHYKNCKISRKKDTLDNDKTIVLIKITLTKDESEAVSFMDKFNESYKLFRMGRKGSFTLKQVWDKIKIVAIEKTV